MSDWVAVIMILFGLLALIACIVGAGASGYRDNLEKTAGIQIEPISEHKRYED